MATSASDKECEAYLNMFRVCELKRLLRSMKVPINGRKRDLLSRAEQLLKSGSPEVIEKIKEIYVDSFGLSNYAKTPPKPPPMSHNTGVPPPVYVKHPNVTFKSHPFYQKLDTLIRPTVLGGSAHGHNYRGQNAMVLQFHLTTQQANDISSSETTPRNYRIQVILRFCRRETSCEQEDYCPRHCFVQVNKTNCSIPELGGKSSGCCPIKPINITPFVHTSPAIPNTITITWQDNAFMPSQEYCVGIELMRVLSSSELVQTLKGKSWRSAEISRALVKDKFKAGKDFEVSATSLRVSLLCPLGKMRLVNPCRSTGCNHLQCFDAGIYLQINEKKPKWICPVCDKPAPFTNLIIDGLIAEICEQSSGTDIEFFNDGSWNTLKSKNRQTDYVSTSPVIISDSPDCPVRSSSRSQPDQFVVIDLTSDVEYNDRESSDETSSSSGNDNSSEEDTHSNITSSSKSMKLQPLDDDISNSTNARLNPVLPQIIPSAWRPSSSSGIVMPAAVYLPFGLTIPQFNTERLQLQRPLYSPISSESTHSAGSSVDSD